MKKIITLAALASCLLMAGCVTAPVDYGRCIKTVKQSHDWFYSSNGGEQPLGGSLCLER